MFLPLPRVPGRLRGPAGVTFAELMLVIALLGILAALAAPRLATSGFFSENAVHRVGSHLLAAQRAAVTRGHQVVVSFDRAAATLRIHYDRDNDGAVDAGEHVRTEELGEGVVYGRAGAPQHLVGAGPVSFTKRQGALPAVTFHRNGSAGEEGGFYLTSKAAAREGRANETRLVVIDRATGRPSWFSYTGGTWHREF